MEEMPHADIMRQALSADIEHNITLLQQALNMPENEDVILRRYYAGPLQVCLIYIEGMADEKKIGDFVLHALKNERVSCCVDDPLHYVLENLEMPQAKPQTQMQDIVRMIIAGMCCLLVENANEALILETRSYPSRTVGQPTNEAVVYGPQEAFNEHLRTNISLVRRYVQSPQLISEKMTLGSAVPTQIALLYLKGVASESCLEEVRRRLKGIHCSTLQGTGALQQLIEDHPFAMLPQMLQTERPDRTAASLEDGQFAILVENSPYALIAPVTLFHLVHASDDSFLRWQYGTALRLIRIIGMIVSLTLPSIYIAMTLYHSHLIPMPLLTSIAESRANVPFPIVVEVLFMEFSFYLLNEAGLRTPSQIGSAFGVVGALILGQAAVSASIISPILIIIIALTGLGNYVIPNYGMGIGLIMYRLFLIFMSSMLGLYGLMIGLFLIITRLCSLSSFGAAYLAPIAPRRRHNPDLLLRLPIWMQKRSIFFVAENSWIKGRRKSA